MLTALDRWLTTEPEPDVECGDCGREVAPVFAEQHLGLCWACYDLARAEARGED